jgi:glycosyltransferase involved in cell wall biosynthesis
VIKDSLKVIHIFAPGPFGGAERVILTGLPAFIKINPDTILYIIRETRVPEHANKMIKFVTEAGIPYKVFECKSRFDIGLITTLFSEIKKFQPDVYHAHGIKAVLYGFLSKAYAQTYIATHHGKTSHTSIVRIYEKIEDFILKRTNATIAVSEKMQKDLKKSGIDINSVDLVNNPLAIIPSVNNRKSCKKTTFLFVGRLSPEKGVSDFLKALALLPSHHEYTFHIVGSGQEEKSLKSEVIELDLIDKVIFEGFQDDVTKFYNESDCLVMPSHREGLPMTLIEACASSLPIIASNVGGIPQLVDDKNGILVPPNNPIQIKRAIENFIEHKAHFLKEANIKSLEIKEYYSPKKWAKKTLDLYYKSIRRL